MWYKKRIRINRVLFAMMMTANVIMFSLHLSALIMISMSFQGEHYKCYLSFYYQQPDVENVEKLYHFFRIILLLIVINKKEV